MVPGLLNLGASDPLNDKLKLPILVTIIIIIIIIITTIIIISLWTVAASRAFCAWGLKIP
jgi:hypothetical protein